MIEYVAHTKRKGMSKARAVRIFLSRNGPRWHADAPQSDADGWIEWHGHGVPPVADDLTQIDYRLRGGGEDTCAFYGLRWDHRDNSMGDIIAYRIHKDDSQ